MPFELALHERDALPFDGVGNDDDRASLGNLLRLFECLNHFGNIMPITFQHIPSERRPLVGQRFKVQRIRHRRGQLHLVVVDNRHQARRLVVPGIHGRFPVLAFLQLSVTDQDIGIEIHAALRAAQRHADTGRQPLPERAGGHVHTRRLEHAGMPLQHRPHGVKRTQLLLVEVAAVGQHRIVTRTRVSLTQQKAIPLRHIGVARIDVHHMEVERHQNLHLRKRSSRMPALRIRDRVDDHLPPVQGG